MTNEQQKAIEKIKKLLKLAGNQGAQGNEASNALSQARALLSKYQLSMTDVELSTVNRCEQKSTVKTKPSQWESALAQAVAKIMGCKLVFRPGFYASHRGQWVFIGIDVSPELAAYAFEVLLRQLKRDRANYVKNQLKRCRPSTQKARAVAFCESWVFAVWHKIEKMALGADENPVLSAYMDKHFSAATTMKYRDNPNGPVRDQDHAAGFSAGRQAELNHGVAGHQAKPVLLTGG